MSSTQRTVFVLAATISGASAPVASEPQPVPVGANLGGVQVVVSLGTGGSIPALSTVSAVLQGTNQSDPNDDTAIDPAASWETVPGGTLAPVSAAGAAFIGDGTGAIDLTPYRWIRVLPVVVGVPVSINVNAYGKFDYDRG